MPNLPNLALERAHGGIVAGIDEAGRGPWAGPVVAAAVILDPNLLPHGINDSKKLSAARREKLYTAISSSALVGVGIASIEEIDALNILGATKLAMRRALEKLAVKPEMALVDGNQPPELPCRVETVIGGDGLSLSIAAASIVAKVTRDRMMAELAQEFPHYGWEKNMGYGTKEHQAALLARGVTPHHRRSFAPIRSMIDKQMKDERIRAIM